MPWIALRVNPVMFIVEETAGASAGSACLQAGSLDPVGDSANYGMRLFVAGSVIRHRARAASGKGVFGRACTEFAGAGA